MHWPVYFPNVKHESVKELAIRLLSENASLTNKEIQLLIKKRYGKAVAYQSVRQALLELIDAGVIVRDGSYSLNHKWINTTYEYSKYLKERFIDQLNIQVIDENTKEIQLQSLFQLGHFFLYGLRDDFFDANEPLHMYVRHLWFPFMNKEKRNIIISILEGKKNVFVSAKKGILNRMFGSFYGKYGKVTYGKIVDPVHDIIVQGNAIARIHMPKKLRDDLDTYYSMKNPFSMDRIHGMSDVMFAPYTISIRIERDAQLAEELRSLTGQL